MKKILTLLLTTTSLCASELSILDRRDEHVKMTIQEYTKPVQVLIPRSTNTEQLKFINRFSEYFNTVIHRKSGDRYRSLFHSPYTNSEKSVKIQSYIDQLIVRFQHMNPLSNVNTLDDELIQDPYVLIVNTDGSCDYHSYDSDYYEVLNARGV